jgi:DNA-binding NarL/FixJ family response regulator
MVGESLKALLDKSRLYNATLFLSTQNTSQAVREHDPDVVILEPQQMRGGFAWSVISEIHTKNSKYLPILIVSTHRHSTFMFRCFKEGAQGFLSTDVGPKELYRAIRKVKEGKIYTGAHTLKILQESVARDRTRANGTKMTPQLNARQEQVFSLMSKGNDTKKVAESIGRTVKTTQTIQNKIAKKLGLRNSKELFHMAVSTDT